MKSTKFDKWAQDFDVSVRGSEGYPFEGYWDILDKMRSYISHGSGFEILDIGIGTGNLSYELYKRGVKIYGLDFSARMLELAKEKMPHAEFYEYDFNSGLPDEIINKKFDFIISSYAFHHLSDDMKIDLIMLLKDLLKQNAKIIIGDISFPTQRALDECKKSVGKLWDDEEFYIIAEDFIPKLKQSGLSFEYTQVSVCAGIITIT